MERRPIFKHIHPVYELTPGVVRLGEQFGVAVDLEDEQGSVRRLVQLLDGTRTLEQVHMEMMAHFPALTRQELDEAVSALHEMGFLYDRASEEQTELTAQERDRYKGNLNLFEYYANFDRAPAHFQERLKQAKVTILGMGAFGSSLLFNLAGLGVLHAKIV
ncbi:MAG TPA: ThiF family adenylyltransferase, partial [Bacilli bacterium]|nr:ThiF family adenylyltransferase [Bacilli bacterium]